MENTDPKADPALVHLFQMHDEITALFRRNLVMIAEQIQDNTLKRATVVASIMEARAVTRPTAESTFSRSKRILNDPVILENLKDGTVPLRIRFEVPVERKNTVKKCK